MKKMSSLCAAACAASVCAGSARAALVFNGGFETGDFTGWSWAPSPGTMTEVDTGTPHSGSFRLEISTSGSVFDELSQSLATLPGQQYMISFWLSDSGLPSPASAFEVWWEGTQVFGLEPIDVPGSGYAQFTIPVTATGPGSLLRLRMYDADRVSYVDDVSVVAVPAPGAAVTFAVAGCLTATRRRRS